MVTKISVTDRHVQNKVLESKRNFTEGHILYFPNQEQYMRQGDEGLEANEGQINNLEKEPGSIPKLEIHTNDSEDITSVKKEVDPKAKVTNENDENNFVGEKSQQINESENKTVDLENEQKPEDVKNEIEKDEDLRFHERYFSLMIQQQKYEEVVKHFESIKNV